MIASNMAKTGIALAIFALVCTALLAVTNEATKDRIAEEERLFTLRTLSEMVPATLYDNDLVTDSFQLIAPNYLGNANPKTIYRARNNDAPVAAVISATAPNGYSGPIELLVAVNTHGKLMGVRVVKHKETPGLGDGIEIQRNDWITDFDGRSLSNPGHRGWAVKKDHGVFDQLTGATITPRAVVKAVHLCLQYFEKQQSLIFSAESGKTIDATE
ncbi:MAG: electron transport complex subunit RsxG [Gammaproteobacteria bacterium]|nr:electron transport complex subunit RsxG [Gammaproteobacteria bacterium]